MRKKWIAVGIGVFVLAYLVGTASLFWPKITSLLQTRLPAAFPPARVVSWNVITRTLRVMPEGKSVPVILTLDPTTTRIIIPMKTADGATDERIVGTATGTFWEYAFCAGDTVEIQFNNGQPTRVRNAGPRSCAPAVYSPR